MYRNDLIVDGRKHGDYIQSAAAAIQNMLLTSYSLGIASCWICNLPSSREMRPILNIPKNYDVIAYVALGYPKDKIGSNSEQIIYHYGSEDNFVSHKRRFNYEQVTSYNAFATIAGDSTTFKYKQDSIFNRYKSRIRKTIKRFIK